MPKFSAYMRGEKGVKGDVGQASLLDGVVNSTSELPTPNQQKNYVYYVNLEDGIHLYVSEEGRNWEDLGVVTAGFSTYQPTSVTTLNWNEEAIVSISTLPSSNGSKSFQWNFGIPQGREGGFSTYQSTSVTTLNWNEEATVEIFPNENTPSHSKSFFFNFGIPHGREAGFSTTQRASISTLSWTSEATISVSTTEDSEENPFYSKVFDFNFGIPQGEPAGFGNLDTEIEILNHLSTATFEIEEGGSNRSKDLNFKLGIPAAHPAGFGIVNADSYDLDWDFNPEVSITTSGNDWEKNFDFSFGIPHGRPAGFAEEMEVSVTTLSSISNKNENDNIVKIEKTEENEAEIKNIKVNIEPIQDLHGYDNPWPAGGGKNLYNPTTVTENSWIDNDASAGEVVPVNGYWTTDFIPITAGATYYRPLTGSSRSCWYDANKGVVSYFGANGQAVTAPTGATYVRFCGLESSYPHATAQIQFELGSTATSYAPYSNICPISGWNQAKVTRTGKNLLDKDSAEIGTAWNGASNANRARLIVPLVVGKTYTMTMNGTSSIDSFYTVETDVIPPSGSGSERTYPYTFTATKKYLNIGFNKTSIAQADIDALKLQLELGTTATPYVPYSGTSVTIDLDGTRYGGTVDVINGTMTVTKAFATFTGANTENWNVHGSIASWFYTDVLSDAYKSNNDANFAVSNVYKQRKYYDATSLVNGEFSIGSPDGATYLRLIVKDTRFTTVSEFTTNLASNPLQVCYTLATPQTVTLTPAQLALLQGENNVWADCGNIDIDYSSINDAYVNITPDETTPDYAKKFNFEFGIPNGVPGGFGNISVSTVQVDTLTPASVSITTSGPESAKNFDFLFKIPRGKTGQAGSSAGIYLRKSFLSTDTNLNQPIFWDENVLHIKNEENHTIPICVVNNQNENIAAAFKIDKENEVILHYADEPFDGDIYLIAESTIPHFEVHTVETVDFEDSASVTAEYDGDDYSTVYLNFNIPRGASITEIEKDESYVSDSENRYIIRYDSERESYFYVTKGDKGDEGEIGPEGPEGEPGPEGPQGNGIESITKLETIGLTTSYQINYDNGETYLFEVVNGEKGDTGNGIVSIQKTDSDTMSREDTYTITFTDNSTTTFIITNGEMGPQGPKGDKGDKGDSALTFEIGEVTGLTTEDPYVNISSSTDGNIILDIGLPKGLKGDEGPVGPQGIQGPKGDTGNSIISIIKEGTYGLIDTYRINFSNGDFSTFTVTNGEGGASDWNEITGIPEAFPTHWNLIEGMPEVFPTTWNLIEGTPSLNYLPLSGGTLTGLLKLSSNGLETNSTAGYTLNNSGNFQHKRNTTGDTFNILNNSGVSKFSVVYESGNVSLAGDLTLKNDNTDITAATLSASTYKYVRFTDKNGNYSGWLGSNQYQNGNITSQLATRRRINNANIDTYINLTITSTGVKNISLDNDIIWISAINTNANINLKDSNIWFQKDNVNKSQIYVSANNQLSFRNTANSSNYSEIFYTPIPDIRSSNGSYNILTTKNVVTIAQGGTGASTSTAAITNLGVLPLSGGEMTGIITTKVSSSYTNAVKGLNTGLYSKYTNIESDIVNAAITIQTKDNGGWSIGNYNNENLLFIYGSSNATVNTVKKYTINTEGDYSGKATNVTGLIEIDHGGTGKTTKDEAWTNLGGGTIGKKNKLAVTDIPLLSLDKVSISYGPSAVPNSLTTGWLYLQHES